MLHSGPDGLVVCAVTGERIARDQAHMDPPTADDFRGDRDDISVWTRVSLNDVPLTTGQNDQVSPEVTYEVLSETFRSYHAEVARLEFVKNTINLAQSRPSVKRWMG
jgi:hypothetical protein